MSESGYPSQIIITTKRDPAFVDRIDNWRRSQPGPIPSRAKAIRDLVALGIAASTSEPAPAEA